MARLASATEVGTKLPGGLQSPTRASASVQQFVLDVTQPSASGGKICITATETTNEEKAILAESTSEGRIAFEVLQYKKIQFSWLYHNIGGNVNWII